MLQPLNVQRRADGVFLIKNDFSAVVARFQCIEDVVGVVFAVAVALNVAYFVTLCWLWQRFKGTFGSDFVVSRDR